jgi:hypothetical protein
MGTHCGVARSQTEGGRGSPLSVSLWETLVDAKQMGSLQAMLDLAKVLVDAGVRFERPITNHETLRTI